MMQGHQVIFESAGRAALKPFDVSSPGAGEALLEIDYTVISAGTERSNLLNLPNTSGGFPYYPGYSGTARVIDVGEGVRNVRVGDRVLVTFYGAHCTHAVQKAADLMAIRDSRIDPLEAAFTNIASMGLQGVRKLQLQIGESAMVIGLGLLGVFACQFAVLDGAIPVIVSDFDQARRELALKLGASDAFSPDEPELAQKVRNLTYGQGANGIVEVTGAAVALRQALACVAWQGRISLLGCTRVPDANIDFYQQVHKPGVSLIGAHNHVRPAVDSRPGHWTSQDDFCAILAFFAAGKLRVRPIISEIVTPEQAPAVYARLCETANPPLGIVFDWTKMR